MLKTHADLEYVACGFFVAFVPTTPAGDDAWRVLAAQTAGTGKVQANHLQTTLNQLRAAGYIVRKAKPQKATIDDDALLDALLH